MSNRNKQTKIIVGYLSKEQVDILGLSISPAPILIGDTNINHIKNKHPEDFRKYYDKLPEILSSPDYIGKHPSKGSIEYIKTYDENVLIAVRISGRGILFVRSLYTINSEKLTRYIESGTTFKIHY